MSKNIKNFEFFLLEKLGINEDVKILAELLCNEIKDKKIGIYNISKGIPNKLPIKEIIIKIDKNLDCLGELDLNLSKLKNGMWSFYLKIKPKEEYIKDTIYHECNHMLQTIYQDQKEILNKLNYIKASNIANKNYPILNKCKDFCMKIYYSSESEINSMVSETYGDIKQFMENKNLKKLDNKSFNMLITTSKAYKVSTYLINFDINKSMEDLSISDRNKFFYLYEENKNKLDKINDKKGFLKTILLIYRAFKDIYNNKNAKFPESYDITYKPKKDSNYYETWIHSQGEKLKRKLFKLYDHFI